MSCTRSFLLNNNLIKTGLGARFCFLCEFFNLSQKVWPGTKNDVVVSCLFYSDNSLVQSEVEMSQRSQIHHIFTIAPRLVQEMLGRLVLDIIISQTSFIFFDRSAYSLSFTRSWLFPLNFFQKLLLYYLAAFLVHNMY